MIDGRELPGCDANPPEELMRGKYYLGRQAHENDGAFYYWGNLLWKPEPLPEPYSDLLAKRKDYGGIHPRTRPKRNGNRAWWFFDPTNARNMREAAEDFVHNLATSRGESTRHSGPSTLFRYFFQAGYDYLIAEQMYGPEELTLASLRATSNTYHNKGFGAHLATQWSSTPHDTPEHAERYFLSLRERLKLIPRRGYGGWKKGLWITTASVIIARFIGKHTESSGSLWKHIRDWASL